MRKAALIKDIQLEFQNDRAAGISLSSDGLIRFVVSKNARKCRCELKEGILGNKFLLTLFSLNWSEMRGSEG